MLIQTVKLLVFSRYFVLACHTAAVGRPAASPSGWLPILSDCRVLLGLLCRKAMAAESCGADDLCCIYGDYGAVVPL